MPMTKEEMLARIASATRNKGASTLDPDVIKAIQESMQSLNEPNLPVAPPKPDPEAAANMQINQAVNRQAMTPEQARTTMNPVTGLPYSADQPAATPEEAKRREEMQMKADFLRRRSQQGY